MAYELEGTIKVIMDVMKFGSGFTKREFVVTVGDDRYPQDIKLEFVKDKVSLLERYESGQRVKVGFDIKGGEHNGRYYVNLQAWRIHPADGSEPPAGGGGGERPERTERPPAGGGGERPWRDAPGGGGGGGRGPDRRGGGGGGGDRFERGAGGGRGFDRERDRGGDRRGGARPQGGRHGGGDDDDFDF